MELNIISEKENPLFNRKEIKATIDAEATPSRIETTKLISEKFSTQPETIKIKTILSRFGSKTFTVNANIYTSREEKDKIELKKKKDIEAEKKQTEATKKEEEKQKPEEPKEEIKESKEEISEETKEVKDETKQEEVKEELQETKEKPKGEMKENTKEEIKQVEVKEDDN
ncbi:hypothetical protein ACFL0X_00380 [Nanoarchaeota archaeon]